MNDKPKKLTRRDVRRLYAVHGTTVRDQACVLLGGDPIQAQAVTRRVFASMIGMPADELQAAENLPAWIADEVVRFCLEATGNREVADWEEYFDRHPEADPEAGPDDEDETDAPTREAPALPSNVIPLRPRAASRLPATRSARDALVIRLPPGKPRVTAKPAGPSGPEVKS